MSAQFFVSAILIVIVIHALLGLVSYGILLERKIASWIQDRIGPNRVGPKGLLQPIADGIKFLIKEDYMPPGVDKVLFTLAPALAVMTAMIGWAVVPWGGYWDFPGCQIFGWEIPADTVLVAGAPISIGIIYIMAVGSLAVYGVVLGGFASNNKYSFLGGLRATAQMVSYEIPMGVCILVIVLMHGTARADYLVELQANGVWNIFYQPVLAYIFFICTLAECNRAPFDLAECEQELVGGFHTEYSSMRFALFFLGEYLHMITASAFFALLFLGGWDLPFVKEPIIGEAAGIGWVLLKSLVFLVKVAAVIVVMMLIRWTLPRFRFDQLMKHAWRSLIPVTLTILLLNGLIIYFGKSGTNWILMFAANIGTAFLLWRIGHYIPQGPPVNRRVELEGSRFSAPSAPETA